MTAPEKILELLSEHNKMTARQITDLLVRENYRWPGANPDVNIDRVHEKLVALLLRGSVKRKKFAGVWVWSLA